MLSDKKRLARDASSDHESAKSNKAEAWACIRWHYSLLLPAALLLTIATMIFTESKMDLLELNVTSSTSGEPLPGTLVTVGPIIYLTDDSGMIIIERPVTGTHISAQSNGFGRVDLAVSPDASSRQTIQLQPSMVNGFLLDADNGEPIEGAEIVLQDAAGTVVADTRSDSNGTYIFKNLPEGAVLWVDAGGFGTHSEPVQGRHQINFQLTRSVVLGTVLNIEGRPVQGAAVESGRAKTVTDRDGHFRLDGITQGVDLTISAPGYESQTRTIDRDRLDDVVLEPQVVRAVVESLSHFTMHDELDSLITSANTSDIHAAEEYGASARFARGHPYDMEVEALRPDEGDD